MKNALIAGLLLALIMAGICVGHADDKYYSLPSIEDSKFLTPTHTSILTHDMPIDDVVGTFGKPWAKVRTTSKGDVEVWFWSALAKDGHTNYYLEVVVQDNKVLNFIRN